MTKSHKVQDMASEYRFDYKKAKPNRFAKKVVKAKLAAKAKSKAKVPAAKKPATNANPKKKK